MDTKSKADFWVIVGIVGAFLTLWVIISLIAFPDKKRTNQDAREIVLRTTGTIIIFTWIALWLLLLYTSTFVS